MGIMATSLVSNVAAAALGLCVGAVAGLLLNSWARGWDQSDDRELAVHHPISCGSCGDHGPSLLVRATCANCGSSAWPDWWHVPVASALTCAITMLSFGWHKAVLPYLVLSVCGSVISAIDLRTMLIPRVTVWITAAALISAIAIASLWLWLGDHDRSAVLADAAKHAALGALIFGGLFALVATISPNGMGWGDVRLAAVLGLALGWIDLMLVLAGLMASSAVGLIGGLATKGLKNRHEAFPFGPALVAGTLLAVWLREPILNWLIPTA